MCSVRLFVMCVRGSYVCCELRVHVSCVCSSVLHVLCLLCVLYVLGVCVVCCE